MRELEAIGMVWNAYKYRKDLRWEKGFRYAEKYYKEHGDLLVPKDYKCPDGYCLGGWLASQRMKVSMDTDGPDRSDRLDRLDEEKKARLEQIGMVWHNADVPVLWLRKYLEAEEYYSKHGNLFPAEKTEISGWLCSQRQHRKKGDLTDTQIAMLDKIGMVWRGRSDLKASPQWLRNIEIAQAYYEEHGNINVVQRTVYRGFKLGEWVGKNRVMRRSGKLSDYQIEELEKLGIDWMEGKKEAGVGYTARWYQNYLTARRYYEEYGTIDVPKNLKYGGINLGTWVYAQRSNRYIDNGVTMSDEQIAMLDDIGFVWRKRDEWSAWLEHYEKLKETGLVSRTYVDDTGYALGTWYHRQRSAYNQGKLSNEKIGLLEDIGVVWGKNEDGIPNSWMRWYELCREYVKDNGDFRIAGSYITPDGDRLGKWVKRNRNEKHKLNEKQIELLDTLGMIWQVRPQKGA